MTEVYCNCTDCLHHCDINRCGLDEICISDKELREDGFYPRCDIYDSTDEEVE